MWRWQDQRQKRQKLETSLRGLTPLERPPTVLRNLKGIWFSFQKWNLVILENHTEQPEEKKAQK